MEKMIVSVSVLWLVLVTITSSLTINAPDTGENKEKDTPVQIPETAINPPLPEKFNSENIQISDLDLKSQESQDVLSEGQGVDKGAEERDKDLDVIDDNSKSTIDISQEIADSELSQLSKSDNDVESSNKLDEVLLGSASFDQILDAKLAKSILAGEINLVNMDAQFIEDLDPVELAKFKSLPMPTEFDDYDLDGDGFVSLEELINITGAEENVGMAFNASDINQDGRLTEGEFYEAPWMLQGDPFNTVPIKEIVDEIQVEKTVIREIDNEEVKETLKKEVEELEKVEQEIKINAMNRK